MGLTNTILGTTKIEVPVFGLGGIAIGRPTLTDKEAIGIIKQAIDFGVRVIDTCNTYGCPPGRSAYGRSEERIAKAIKGKREEIILVAKSRAIYNPEDCLNMVNSSLQKLEVDYIDVLALKNLDNDECVENINVLAPLLEKLKAEGKIKHTGFSSHSPEHADLAIQSGVFDIAELPYNFANTYFKKSFELADSRNMGKVIMKPYGGGRLFDNIKIGSKENIELLAKALSYAISFDTYPVVIPGIGSQQELDAYLNAISNIERLTSEEMLALEKSAADLGDDFCRACGYCTQYCESEIPIDKLLPIYDKATKINTDTTFIHNLQKEFKEYNITSESCTNCKKCEENCPYNIEISQRLKNAVEYFSQKIK